MAFQAESIWIISLDVHFNLYSYFLHDAPSTILLAIGDHDSSLKTAYYTTHFVIFKGYGLCHFADSFAREIAKSSFFSL